MSLWVYTFCWNEEKILPFFLRHYKHLLNAERIIVYDNESDDNSLSEIGRWKNLGVEARTYKTGGMHSESGAMVQIRNECWHEARGRADWVAVVDCDELLFHHDFSGFLRRCEAHGTTLVRAYGFEMVAAEFPRDDGRTQLSLLVRKGVQSPLYSKPCLFRPDHIRTISYAHGAHDCKAPGNVRYMPSGSLKMLHYKRLGWDYFWNRVERLRNRSDPRDLKQGYSEHYRYPQESHLLEFQRMMTYAVDVTT
mgnify:CR=1 FL=1